MQQKNNPITNHRNTMQLALFQEDNNQLIPLIGGQLSTEVREPKPYEPDFNGLRDYQLKVVEDIYSFWANGQNSTLLYAPTGSGKTMMSGQVISDFIADGKKVLFLVHRLPLINQTINTVSKILGYTPETTIYQGSNTKIVDSNFYLGMVQSVKLSKLPEDIDLVVFDEVHTTAYYKIVREIKNRYQPIQGLGSTCFLGLTATPYRTRREQSFCWLFQSVVRSPDIVDLIRDGYLTPPRCYGYNGLVDYSKLDVSNGDFTQKSLRIVCNPELNAEVVRKYIDIAWGQQAIAFCGTVSQAENMAQQFTEAEISCGVWVGNTPEFERKLLLEKFNRKEIQVIVSVMALCEGFDSPIASVALIARPTMSKALYIQMMGRVLRKHPDKKEALILDFCENFQRLKLHPTKHFDINLCPQPAKNWEGDDKTMTKNCPNCGAVVHISIRECPECGYEFKRLEEERELFVDNFGEILSPEQLAEVKYLRSQTRRIFTELEKQFMSRNQSGKLNPIRAKHLFFEKYRYFPPHEWFIGAIFGGKSPETNRRRYLTYLHWLFPERKDKFYEDILEHEFGKIKQKPQGFGVAKPENVDLIPTQNNWHIILGVSKFASKDVIKKRYRELSVKYHPDLLRDDAKATQIMQTINVAYDYSKQFLG